VISSEELAAWEDTLADAHADVPLDVKDFMLRAIKELKAHRSWAGIYGKSDEKTGRDGIHANAHAR
jgi:hypothetical protein